MRIFRSACHQKWIESYTWKIYHTRSQLKTCTTYSENMVQYGKFVCKLNNCLIVHCYILFAFCPLPSVLWRCWLGARKGILSVKNSGGVLVWSSVWSKVQTCIWPSWCHCHSLSLASVKSRLVLPFWYWLIWVVQEKGPLNGCVCVCVLSDFSDISKQKLYTRVVINRHINLNSRRKEQDGAKNSRQQLYQNSAPMLTFKIFVSFSSFLYSSREVCDLVHRKFIICLTESVGDWVIDSASFYVPCDTKQVRDILPSQSLGSVLKKLNPIKLNTICRWQTNSIPTDSSTEWQKQEVRPLPSVDGKVKSTLLQFCKQCEIPWHFPRLLQHSDQCCHPLQTHIFHCAISILAGSVSGQPHSNWWWSPDIA